MKTTYILLTLVAGAFTACHPGAQQSTVSTDTVITSPIHIRNACYTKIIGRDTIQLTLNVEDSVATGNLSYNFFEKDKNTGKISGLLHNDILRAQYNYYSEGVESSRPVIFKLTDKTAFEAMPEKIDDQGIPVFSANNQELKFDTIPFHRCD
ncbi:hypothetical protein ACDQ55_14000 [Chitinophaga sp. 30R24]|uniref:hypothetical protein n=1 Tax=Chitinophaga sp. 30R24 TaxID=3248838 RepID=UPI003B8F6CFC